MKATSSTYTGEFLKNVLQIPNHYKRIRERFILIEISTKGLDSIFCPITEAEAATWNKAADLRQGFKPED